MEGVMQLDVWGGDWGVASVDVNCLQILVYCKFAGAPVQVNVSNNPYRSNLPRFRNGTEELRTLSEVVSFLKSKNINADYSLSNSEVSQVSAYGEYLKEKLWPALQYVWFVDQKNYEGLTRPWYAKALPFPLNYYYPGRYERDAKALITVLYGSLEEEAALIETQVYSDGEKCLTMLSTRLGDGQYFLGSSPTSLDALIFSYLAPLLKAPFPRATLQNHLKACTNLVAFVDRISQKYYPSLNNEYQKRSTEERKKKEADIEFPNKRRNQFLFGVMATAAMAAYALTSGKITIEDDDDDDDYDDMFQGEK